MSLKVKAISRLQRSQNCWELQLVSHFGASESVTQKHSWHSALEDLQSEDLLPLPAKAVGLGKCWCGSGWGWIQCWISLPEQQLWFVRQEARHGKAEGWETNAQKHSACAGVSCCCGCTCQASHRGYWAINLWQKAELPSHSWQIDSLFSCRAWASPRLCKRSCSSSSAPSGVFPSEPEFTPFFKSDIPTCSVEGLSEVFYRTCRPGRSLRGGILIKKRNVCLGKRERLFGSRV